MTGNSFGKIFKITTWGESHGKAVGVVIDGCPPNLKLSENDIQKELDRRKPGQSNITTSRSEDDIVEILSGVFDGQTTGTPISLIVRNKDADSSKYEKIKNLFRPGHADFTYFKKYGIRDYRGGGRSSARETVARVAAGAIAKKLLNEMSIKIFAHTIQIGNIKVKTENIDLNQIENNVVRCADIETANKMIDEILKVKKELNSVGGIVEVIIKGCPIGIGEPVFDKLDANLGKALLSIGAVKGIEFGRGFGVAEIKGSENNDSMNSSLELFNTNNCGGILGGISTGQDIIIRIAVKPTPSISQQQETIDVNGNDQIIEIEGRHDPCIVPRIIPIVESMVALTLVDGIMINKLIGEKIGR